NAPQRTPSFAGVSYDQAIARARALVPALRERAARAEAARVMPPETLFDLHASGALRTLQPKRYGGMELDFVAYADFPYEIARGCASTGWNLANLRVHHWMLAQYDERAQEEVWGANPEALIASGIAFPQGRATKTDGGFVISGRWNFSSCSNVADWKMLGMRSTGSMTVAAKDVFVPEHKALDMLLVRGGAGFPGAKVNPNPAYQVAANPLLGHGIGMCAVGNAQAALEHTMELVRERSTNYTGMRMRDFQGVQLRVGIAGAKIDCARLLLRNDCLEGQDYAKRGVVPDVQTKLACKRNLAFAVNLCTEAVDLLHAVAGANGIYESYPLERIF